MTKQREAMEAGRDALKWILLYPNIAKHIGTDLFDIGANALQGLNAALSEQPHPLDELTAETERLGLYPWQQPAQSDEELARETLRRLNWEKDAMRVIEEAFAKIRASQPAQSDEEFILLLRDELKVRGYHGSGRSEEIKILRAALSKINASQPDAQAIRNAALEEAAKIVDELAYADSKWLSDDIRKLKTEEK